ncbi:MAG TPA: hypothetical protein VFN30_02715 [Chitinophagaceae bacterium]|nr:hypothetical protein [Chitinophagaceae bacterium]
MRQLFKEIQIPAKYMSVLKEVDCKWFTWSDSFREEIPRLKQQFKRLKSIDFIFLKKYKEYNYTYQVNIKKLDSDFIDVFIEYTRSLLKYNPRHRIYFFTNLIDEDINGRLYHFIIALFRSVIVKISKNDSSALYSPLTAGKHESEFPLHCDLYIPKILFNIFEKVPDNATGASIFVKTDVLFKDVIPFIKMVPIEVVKKLKSFIYGARTVDNYDEFFSLLYNEKHPWAISLKTELHKRKLKIRLLKGQGYMIDDTVWMHGRDKTIGGVSSKRLHRLIFNIK